MNTANRLRVLGRCYCGRFKYEITAQFDAQLQCHCRECRYSTGGAPNTVGLTKKENFKILKGKLNSFVKKEMKTPRRHFCSTCGTHIYAESPTRPNHLILKVGTLDDPSTFFPQQAQFLTDVQPYDAVPKGVPSYQSRKPLQSGGIKVDDLPSV